MTKVSGVKREAKLATLFVLAGEKDAAKIWSDDRSAIAQSFKTMEESNVDDELISWLYTMLIREPYEPHRIASRRISSDAKEGRWLFNIPSELIVSLADFDKDSAIDVAEQCDALDEPTFAPWKKKDLAPLFLRLASFAKQAKQGKSGILMLMDVSQAPKLVALKCRVRQLKIAGDDLVAAEQLEEALKHYEEACTMLSSTKGDCDVRSNAYFATGNAYFLSGKYNEALVKFEMALETLDDGRPPGFVFQAMGRCYYEAGDLDQAAVEFSDAYLTGGLDAFVSSDSKYYGFLLSRVSELGRLVRGWNDSMLFLDLHLRKEFDDEPKGESIRKMCLEAMALAFAKDWPNSIRKFWEAYDVVEAESDGESNCCLWIRAAVGDLNFRNQDYEAGADNLREIMHPWYYMRLGQCEFELGTDMDVAIDYLARAYMWAGRDIFDEQKPKYIEALEKVLTPPLGQTTL